MIGKPKPPFVSVIIPCRNEAGFLPACLESVLHSDYSRQRMEVLIADGRSTDGTRQIVESYSRRDARVRLVDNPARITPAGLNRAIATAQGEIIVRLDAHARIAPDYIQRAVDYLTTTEADNVGGAMHTVARDTGIFATAIQAALQHPFGVGNSQFRTLAASGSTEPVWVDTVFGGCWRKEVFARIGPFNERLARGQDMEFNLRLRRAGGRILLAPDMRSEYYARATFASFWRHNWTNGVWAILPFAYSDVVPVRLRHLIPLGFALSLVASLLAIFSPFPRIACAIPVSYLAATLAAASHAARRARTPTLIGLLPPTFAALHLAYGFGSLWGGLRLAAILLRRFLPAFDRNPTETAS